MCWRADHHQGCRGEAVQAGVRCGDVWSVEYMEAVDAWGVKRL